MNTVNKLSDALGATALQYKKELKKKADQEAIEEKEIQNILSVGENVDEYLWNAFYPDMKWDKLGREAKRRAKKLLKPYRQQMGLK